MEKRIISSWKPIFQTGDNVVVYTIYRFKCINADKAFIIQPYNFPVSLLDVTVKLNSGLFHTVKFFVVKFKGN